MENIEQVDVNTLCDLIQSGKITQVLDVREKTEFEMVRVPEAVNFPLSSFNEKDIGFQKNEPIYVICKSGMRSLKAAEILKNAGFSSVFNVSGGTMAWEQAGFNTDFG